ncbi:extracellular solute-binding protein [Alicyclobacillus ferrooxydans]|nr:extracellular solute-binding protein [Alicyclobacillus ferrooxydans]
MNRNRWMATTATVALSAALVAGCGVPPIASPSTTGNNTQPNQANQANQAANQQTNGQGGQASTDPNATITFYEAMSGSAASELNSLTNTFMSQHPSIRVNLVFNGSFTTEQQKLNAAIAANQPPTIAEVRDTWETDYYNQGLLQPLGGLLSQGTVSDMIPVLKNDNSYNGHLVSAPFTVSADVLYYNTDDFSKAGITSPPTTWSQLEQDAIQISRATGVPGLGFQANWPTFEMFLNQAGGQVLSTDQKQASLNSAAGRNTLAYLNKLVKQDSAAWVVPPAGYLSDGFNTNKYAMTIDSTTSIQFMTNNNTHWSVAPLPKGLQSAVPATGTNIVLFKDASASEQQAAAEYIDFLMSKDNTIGWAEGTGYLPVRQSALTDPAWESFVSHNPNVGIAPTELQDAYFSPRLTALSDVSDALNTQLAACINGNQSTTATLQNMTTIVNQALSH